MPVLLRPLSSLHDDEEEASSFSRWIGSPGERRSRRFSRWSWDGNSSVLPPFGGGTAEVKRRRDKMPRAGVDHLGPCRLAPVRPDSLAGLDLEY
jgi:hypothetical protein